MKHQCLVINRQGVLKFDQGAPNQCKGLGHGEFQYIVAITCPVKLDNNGFIIDHGDIDKAIQNIDQVKSCEKICLFIRSAIEQLFSDNSLVIEQLYVKVHPIPLGVAFMEFKCEY